VRQIVAEVHVQLSGYLPARQFFRTIALEAEGKWGGGGAGLSHLFTLLIKNTARVSDSDYAPESAPLI
jgi:hypothetical protein